MHFVYRRYRSLAPPAWRLRKRTRGSRQARRSASAADRLCTCCQQQLMNAKEVLEVTGGDDLAVLEIVELHRHEFERRSRRSQSEKRPAMDSLGSFTIVRPGGGG